MKTMAILKSRQREPVEKEPSRLPSTIGTGAYAVLATITANAALIDAYRKGVSASEHDLMLAAAGVAAAYGYGLGMSFTNRFTQNIKNKMRLTIHGGVTAFNGFLLANDGHALNSHLPVALISVLTGVFGTRYALDLNEWRKLRRESKA